MASTTTAPAAKSKSKKVLDVRRPRSSYLLMFYSSEHYARIKDVLAQVRKHFDGRCYESLKSDINDYWTPERIKTKLQEKGLSLEILDIINYKKEQQGGMFSKDILYRMNSLGDRERNSHKNTSPEVLAFLPFLEPFCSYSWEELSCIAKGVDPALIKPNAEPQEDLVDVVQDFVSQAGGIEALKSAGLTQKEINCLLAWEKPSHTVLGLLAPVLQLEAEAIAALADKTTWLEKPKCVAKV